MKTIALDVRELLHAAGLIADKESPKGSGGFTVSVVRGRVEVGWTASDDLYDHSFELEPNQPQHPLVQFERTATAIMEHALGEILYAAGYGVARVPEAGDTDSFVFVLTEPRVKPWRAS
ncbi:hypothetical protein [Actinomadura sp. WAC 06369]|uniref:hypothetical protein n=1 Tax=Actinomadura sp. WAC 06369 TaxID=2203193 RepID=UPI000F7B7D90|nr:hypothetical protein [Actinomadura sp. WAC 06369]